MYYQVKLAIVNRGKYILFENEYAPVYVATRWATRILKKRKEKEKEKEKSRPSLRICANLSVLKFLHCLQVRLHLRQVDRVIESARNNSCN